jgi:tetratricopeptide (TPR) repeat protein
MAFGLGFKKAKVLSTAEKLVAQGKIAAAIEEYQKVLKHDKKDLIILNTVADLCVRIGKNEEAVERFNQLAERCLEAGLVPRAIATYKRITKVAPDSVYALLKLGELYAMQGLLRDAKAHYMQAVEYYTGQGNKDAARDVFEKLLMLDAENPALQVPMAELYAGTGKKEEAISTYLGAASRYLERNQPAQAGSAIESLLRLDPQNMEARILLGRAQLEQGSAQQAAQTLQAIPSFASYRSALGLLFHALQRQGDADKAREIAQQLFEAHGDFSAIAEIAEDFRSRGELGEALEIYRAYSEQFLAQAPPDALIEGLRQILASDPSNTGALELLLKAHRAAGNVGEVRETSELLAHTYRTQGELEKARQLYRELVSVEPENTDHVQLLKQVEAQMGIEPAARESSKEPAAALISELNAPVEAEPPKAEPLPPREEQLVKNCITEAELYITYRQTARAIDTLQGGLAELPGNTTLMEQLLSLYETSRQYGKAADCCEALTEAYVKLGDGERATRYGELILTYRQKAQDSGSALTEELPSVESAPGVGEALREKETPGGFPKPAPAPAAEEPRVREVDLSMEWASVSGAEESSSSAAADDSLVEEIEFYIQAGLVRDATAELARLEAGSPSHPAIAGFRERLGLGETAGEAVAEMEPISSAELAPFQELEPEQPVVPAAASSPDSEAETGPALDADLPSVAPASPSAAFEPSLDESELSLPLPPAAPSPVSSAEPFASLAGELAGRLSGEFFDAPKTPSHSGAAAQPVASSAAGGKPANTLDEVFADFKAGMEELPDAEDPETHYNMGVAFKEMALYDEAIGEFQKAHQIAAKANDYSHVVQYCSLLATCFLEKGLPKLAVKWYQTALDSPGLEPESVLALLYEMGSAQETAGDSEAALHSFLDVYARNIDYRDVSNRIRSLQRTQ